MTTRTGTQTPDSDEIDEHDRMGNHTFKEPPHGASDRHQHDRSRTKHKKSKGYLVSYGYREVPTGRTGSNVDAAFPNMHGNRQYNVAPFFAPPHMPHQIPQPAAERVKPKLTRYNSAWQLRQLAASTQREIGVPQPVPEQHHPAPVNQPSKRYDSAWQLRQLGGSSQPTAAEQNHNIPVVDEPQQPMQNAAVPAPATEQHTPHPPRSRASRSPPHRSQQSRSRSKSQAAKSGTTYSAVNTTRSAATSSTGQTTTTGQESSSSSGTSSSTSSGSSSSCSCSECVSSSGTTSGTTSTVTGSQTPAARSRHGGSHRVRSQQPHQAPNHGQ